MVFYALVLLQGTGLHINLPCLRDSCLAPPAETVDSGDKSAKPHDRLWRQRGIQIMLNVAVGANLFREANPNSFGRGRSDVILRRGWHRQCD
jgi:hypothetical protein